MIDNLGQPRLTTFGEARPFVMEEAPDLPDTELLLVTPVAVSRSRMLVHGQGLYRTDPDLTVDLLVPLDVYVDWRPIAVPNPVDVDTILVD